MLLLMNNNDIIGLATLKLGQANVPIVGIATCLVLTKAYRIKLILKKYKMSINDLKCCY